MLDIISLILIVMVLFGIAVVSAVIGYAIWFTVCDSQFVRSIRLRRRERLVNKFLKDLKK